MPKAEANNWSARSVIIWSPSLFFFLMNILGKRSDLPFSRKSDRKKEKSTVSFTHVQNIICSQTQLDGIAHEQTITGRQLFAGHVVGFQPMKRKKNLLRIMIILNISIFKWLQKEAELLQKYALSWRQIKLRMNTISTIWIRQVFHYWQERIIKIIIPLMPKSPHIQ